MQKEVDIETIYGISFKMRDTVSTLSGQEAMEERFDHLTMETIKAIPVGRAIKWRTKYILFWTIIRLISSCCISEPMT